MECLLVGGTFEAIGEGKRSSIFSKIINPFTDFHPFKSVHYINGGNIDVLSSLNFLNYDVVLWAANIEDNSISKNIVQSIKKINPFCLLISTKRNTDQQYTVLQIINHALCLKSNLVIEFQKQTENKEITMQLLDPLGNYFYRGNDPVTLGVLLANRIEKLKNFTRRQTKQISENFIHYQKPDPGFIEIVKEHGETFQSFLKAESGSQTRFLGNTSFRCDKGFPSMRIQGGEHIMVSKRNLNKTQIDDDSFVPVSLDIRHGYFYEGKEKPSVDTPVQVILYKHFENINYMLHSHVYVTNEDTFQTSGDPIPCGCLEETAAIISVVPAESDFFAINLIGHGSIIAAKDYNRFKDIKFKPRKIPECFMNQEHYCLYKYFFKKTEATI